MKTFISFLIFILFYCSIAQHVYKTPSGEKYHLGTCRMVKNVSNKVALNSVGIKKLDPCKICKPPQPENLVQSIVQENKAAGTSTATVQCKGKTKAGNRCKHRTSIGNGFCFQHGAQATQSSPVTLVRTVTPITSGTCGAKNKTGGYCKRKVKGGGRCYQH